MVYVNMYSWSYRHRSRHSAESITTGCKSWKLILNQTMAGSCAGSRPITFCSKKFHGKSMPVDHSSVNEWVTNVLLQLFRGYDPKMFWTVMKWDFSTKTCLLDLCDLPTMNSQMGKVPIDRLTMLQFTNMDSSEKQAVVVGKLAKPCCFKNVKTLPFSNFADCKAWMTSQLFTDVMKTLD